MTAEFAADHWAIASGVKETFRALPYAVAVVTVPPRTHGDPVDVGVYLNPTDARCYRLLLRPLVETVAELPLNAFPPLSHSVALGIATAVVGDVLWQATGLYAQALQLGNNSQSARPDDGEIALAGNAHEPYFLHCHLLLRGNPSKRYHPRLPPLRGPPIGDAFPLKAPPGTPHAERVPWADAAELREGASAFRALLADAVGALGDRLAATGCGITVLPVDESSVQHCDDTKLKR